MFIIQCYLATPTGVSATGPNYCCSILIINIIPLSSPSITRFGVYLQILSLVALIDIMQQIVVNDTYTITEKKKKN